MKQTNFALAPLVKPGDGYIPFGTDMRTIVPKETLLCGQAVHVHLTTHTLDELGIPQLPIPGECLACLCVQADQCPVMRAAATPACLPTPASLPTPCARFLLVCCSSRARSNG